MNQHKNDNQIICYCLELRKKDLLNALATKPGSFENFLNKTNAGTKCTACMIDLENFYIKNSSQSYNNNKNFSVKNSLKGFKVLRPISFSLLNNHSITASLDFVELFFLQAVTAKLPPFM